jgi:23S rRNA pseudouridine2605 synthase
VPKVYEAVVEGVPSSQSLAALREGVELEDGLTAPAEVRVLGRAAGSTVIELTLHEGRKRQVKRMCAAVGHPVIRLHRSRYAGLEPGELEPGEWRELTPEEVERLRRTGERERSRASRG